MANYKGWISKAKSDLGLAEKGSKDDDLTLDTAIYHTQQCAEKALKGFLIYHNKSFSKTHDLTKLLQACCAIDSEFIGLNVDAAMLNPFATLYRYPMDVEIIIERKVVSQAIQSAEKILSFVEKKIIKLETKQNSDYKAR